LRRISNRFHDSVWHGGHTARRYRLLAVALVVKSGGTLADMEVYHRLCGPLPPVDHARMTQSDYFIDLDGMTASGIFTRIILQGKEPDYCFQFVVFVFIFYHHAPVPQHTFIDLVIFHYVNF
jgi:hypothetical protein